MHEIDLTKFRKNIKIVRNMHEMSSKDLSERAMLRQMKRIADIEDGRAKPSLEEVYSICVALDQSMDNMLNRNAQLTVTWKQ